MNRLPVIVPPEVDVQILEAVLHIAHGSARNALAWEARFRVALDALGDFQATRWPKTPVIGSVNPSAKWCSSGLTRSTTGSTPSRRPSAVVGVRHGARLPRPGER